MRDQKTMQIKDTWELIMYSKWTAKLTYKKAIAKMSKHKHKHLQGACVAWQEINSPTVQNKKRPIHATKHTQ